MNNILIISQDGNLTCFAKSIAIGERQKTGLIGDKLYEALNKANITLENLIEKIDHAGLTVEYVHNFWKKYAASMNLTYETNFSGLG